MSENTEEKKAKKKAPTPKTEIGRFPMGDCVVTVTRRGDHPITEHDLRRGATACLEMAQELDQRLAAHKATQQE